MSRLKEQRTPVRIVCPHCRRAYVIRVDLQRLYRTSPRAICSRCGGKFEVLQRMSQLDEEPAIASDLSHRVKERRVPEQAPRRPTPHETDDLPILSPKESVTHERGQRPEGRSDQDSVPLPSIAPVEHSSDRPARRSTDKTRARGRSDDDVASSGSPLRDEGEKHDEPVSDVMTDEPSKHEASIPAAEEASSEAPAVTSDRTSKVPPDAGTPSPEPGSLDPRSSRDSLRADESVLRPERGRALEEDATWTTGFPLNVSGELRAPTPDDLERPLPWIEQLEARIDSLVPELPESVNDLEWLLTERPRRSSRVTPAPPLPDDE